MLVPRPQSGCSWHWAVNKMGVCWQPQTGNLLKGWQATIPDVQVSVGCSTTQRQKDSLTSAYFAFIFVFHFAPCRPHAAAAVPFLWPRSGRWSAALMCLPWLLVCAVSRLLDVTACTTILPGSCGTIWQLAVVGVRGAQHQVEALVLIPVCADTVVPLQHTQQTFSIRFNTQPAAACHCWLDGNSSNVVGQSYRSCLLTCSAPHAQQSCGANTACTKGGRQRTGRLHHHHRPMGLPLSVRTCQSVSCMAELALASASVSATHSMPICSHISEILSKSGNSLHPSPTAATDTSTARS